MVDPDMPSNINLVFVDVALMYLFLLVIIQIKLSVVF